jgi:hypothetical protein
MPTIPYKLADGTRTSGITTLQGQQLAWGKGALMYWANQQGLAGRTLNEARDTATVPGTLAHYMIECFLYEKDPVLTTYNQEDIDKAKTAFENFKTWTQQFKFKPLHIEPHLVSEVYRIGGTPDVIAQVKGKRSIVDWKTGRIYSSVFLQLAFYKVAWEEEHPDEPIEGGFHVLRIPKNEDVPSFHHSYWGAIPDIAIESVKSCLQLREAEKELKKLL